MPRWMHRAYAWAGGYFWKSCPVCRRMFGGHEWDGRAVNWGRVNGGNVRIGDGCCPRCPGTHFPERAEAA